MNNFYTNTIKSAFEMVLGDSYLTNKGEEKFVAYSEFLVTVPNDKTNVIVMEVLEDYIKKDGLEIFNNNLEKLVRKGIINSNQEREFTVEENELYLNILNYYNDLIKELKIL